MKVLLDENLPRRLKRDFPLHDVYTVREKGWNGFSNGRLLGMMLDDSFDVLLTFDKNLRYQQNFSNYPISVIVLTAFSNQYIHLEPLVQEIAIAIENTKHGVTIVS